MLSEKNDTKWVEVGGYPLWKVSDQGQVFSCKTNRVLSGRICGPKGKEYLALGIKIDGRIINVKIHILIAKAFVPNPHNKPCVNHIDGNKLNNKASNLEWTTYSENMIHALNTGLKKRLVSKIIPSLKIEDILQLRREGLSQQTIADRYNVEQSTISRLLKSLNHVS